MPKVPPEDSQAFNVQQLALITSITVRMRRRLRLLIQPFRKREIRTPTNEATIFDSVNIFLRSCRLRSRDARV